MADTDLFVENFKAKLKSGGARSNLFRATLTGVEAFGADLEETSFLCKAASLPGSTVAAIDVPFRGRIIKIAGDRTFEQWTVTIINENNFKIRDSFEQWLNEMNSHIQNVMTDPTPSTYKSQMTVEQLSKTGITLKTYSFIGIFPTSVAPIDVSFDSSNAIEEFTVTFDYDYWTSNTTS